MTRSRVIVGLVVVASIQVACEQDPARSVRIPRAPIAGTAVSPGAASAPSGALAAAGHALPALQWNAAVCPPPPDPSGGPSAIVGSGACAFEQHGAATCALTDDDLLMEVTRPMASDGLFMIYLAIENFNQGGMNDNVEIVIGVQTSQGLYRWATDMAHVKLAADLHSVSIAETHLPAVPPMKEQEEVVSGTFTCAQAVR